MHRAVQFTPNAAAFSRDLFARFLTARYHKPNGFEQPKQAVVILLLDNDKVIQRQKLLANTRQGLLI